MLDDLHVLVRRAAISALERTETVSSSVFVALCRVLKRDVDASVRTTAARCVWLCVAGDSSRGLMDAAFVMLCDVAANDADVATRAEAVRLLGHFGAVSSPTLLQTFDKKLLKDVTAAQAQQEDADRGLVAEGDLELMSDNQK